MQSLADPYHIDGKAARENSITQAFKTLNVTNFPVIVPNEEVKLEIPLDVFGSRLKRKKVDNIPVKINVTLLAPPTEPGEFHPSAIKMPV